MPAARTNAEPVETLVLTSVQVTPLSHCHVPWAGVAALASIATPARVLADEPPVTWSVASLKALVNRALTVAPRGLVSSSLTLASETLAAVRVGASLTAVMETAISSVALENAVAPPVVAVLTVVPFTPEVWSQARIVSPEAIVPLKSAFGRK